MNSKGYLLAELLICLAAAAAVGVSAVGAYNSSLRLMQETNVNLEAFNAATGACSAEELAAQPKSRNFIVKGWQGLFIM